MIERNKLKAKLEQLLNHLKELGCDFMPLVLNHQQRKRKWSLWNNS